MKEQDRSTWYKPLIALGHTTMEKAVETDVFGPYHYEAAIVAEHLQAPSYEKTNWDQVLAWYEQLNALQPSAFNWLNLAVVHL